jgi:hypothetical protein
VKLLIGKRLKSVMPARNQLTGYCGCTFSQGRLTSIFAHTSGWATANQAVDKSVFVDPIDKLSVDILTDKTSTARFDASDQMPSVVGTGSFWTQMTQWILGNVSDKQALDNIEKSWP